MPSVNRSPVHFAQMNVTISGKENDTLPVVSINMAVKLRVIRITPPNCDAAPISAYLLG